MVSSWWEGPRGCHQDGLFLAFSVTTLFIVPMRSFNFINLLNILNIYLLTISIQANIITSCFIQFLPVFFLFEQIFLIMLTHV